MLANFLKRRFLHLLQMNGFQYQHLKAKQSKKPFIPLSSLAATETFHAICHFAEGSDSIILFSKKQNHWQTLQIFSPRLNQASGAHEKCVHSFTTHKRTAAVAVNPGTKLSTGREAGQRFSLKLHGDELPPELLQSFPTCPTIQGNIFL